MVSLITYTADEPVFYGSCDSNEEHCLRAERPRFVSANEGYLPPVEEGIGLQQDNNFYIPHSPDNLFFVGAHGNF